MNITPPTEEDISSLAKQWLFIDQTVAATYPGHALDQSLNDLDLIQRLVDDGVYNSDQTWELQSLGVVFGRAFIANNDRFDWAIITDEYGRDPTVRFAETTLCINVLTMISKRIEDGEHLDVRTLYEQLVADLDDLQGNFQ